LIQGAVLDSRSGSARASRQDHDSSNNDNSSSPNSQGNTYDDDDDDDQDAIRLMAEFPERSPAEVGAALFAVGHDYHEARRTLESQKRGGTVR
jgi:hypothetical protein